MKVYAFQVFDFGCMFLQEIYLNKSKALKRALSWNYNEYQNHLNERSLCGKERNIPYKIMKDIKWKVQEYHVK